MKKRQRKHRGGFATVLLRLAAVAAVVYLSATLVISQIDIQVKKQKLDALNADITRQTDSNVELERLLTAGGERTYMEKIARDKLGYAAPDERIFIDMSAK